MYNLFVLGLFVATQVTAQSPVSQDIFDKIVHYTSFAAAAYSDDCTTPPFGSSIVKFFNNTATDTQATLFRDAGANELILAFRGSASPVDLDVDFLFSATNLNIPGVSCSGCQAHKGFHDAYNSIANDVLSAVSGAQSSNPGSKIIVTGHSLGGALSSFAALSLVGQGKQVTAYTYGEPRNGNAAYSAYVDRQVPGYFRVTHANDGVPRIPPTSLGFQHHGVEYWQREGDTNTAATTFNCGGGEPTACIASTNYGDSAINGGHIFYSNFLVASCLYNAGCGFKEP